MTSNALVASEIHNAAVAYSPAPHGGGRCAANNRRGSRCGKQALPGQAVCGQHGGKSPQALFGAAVRLTKASAISALQGQEFEPISDPTTALLRIASESVAVSGELRRRAGQLQDIDVTDRLGGSAIAPTLVAYTQSLKDAADVLQKVLKLNLAERKQRVDEATYVDLVEMFRKAVFSNEADLEYEQAQAVLQNFSDLWDVYLSDEDFAA